MPPQTDQRPFFQFADRDASLQYHTINHLHGISPAGSQNACEICSQADVAERLRFVLSFAADFGPVVIRQSVQTIDLSGN